jgi:hypothetical protein
LPAQLIGRLHQLRTFARADLRHLGIALFAPLDRINTSSAGAICGIDQQCCRDLERPQRSLSGVRHLPPGINGSGTVPFPTNEAYGKALVDKQGKWCFKAALR